MACVMCVCVLFSLGCWVTALPDIWQFTWGVQFSSWSRAAYWQHYVIKTSKRSPLPLNINRPTSRLKINPDCVRLQPISFSLMHVGTARNKETRARGSADIKLHLYHTEIMSTTLTQLHHCRLVYYC